MALQLVSMHACVSARLECHELIGVVTGAYAEVNTEAGREEQARGWDREIWIGALWEGEYAAGCGIRGGARGHAGAARAASGMVGLRGSSCMGYMELMIVKKAAVIATQAMATTRSCITIRW